MNIASNGKMEEVWDDIKSGVNSFVRNNDILMANMNLSKAVEAGNCKAAYTALCGNELVLVKGDNEDTQESGDQRIQVMFDMKKGLIKKKEDDTSVSEAKVNIPNEK